MPFTPSALLRFHSPSRIWFLAVTLLAIVAAGSDAAAQPVRNLTITVAGTGTGTVTSVPGGIACPGDCAETYANGTGVTLTFTPGAGSTFTSATGSCAAAGPSTTAVTDSLVMSHNGACTITFTAIQHALSVTLAGNGSGSVSSTPTGLNCSSGTCAANFNQGTSVTLTAAPSAGSIFVGWSGACSGTASAAVTMSSAQSCTATFAPAAKTITVGFTGPGAGTVTSSPAGLACSSSSGTCSASYAPGTQLVLTAMPAAGSAATLWLGCGVWAGPSLTLTVTADATCMVHFALVRTLTMRLGGDGRGTVTSNPVGLACTGAQGAVCSASFNQGTAVALTAVPASGSEFAGWSGACSATALRSITIDMAADTDCTATFKPGPVTPATGWWWNADEAGRGYSIEISAASGQAFLGAYMYDDGGSPAWYVSAMTAGGDGRSFIGELLQFHGGQSLSGAYTPPEGRVVGVDSTKVRVEFTSDTSGVITFPAPDRAKSETRIPISRFPFVGDGLANPIPAGALPETGWWWNPDEPGRGMFIEVQADTHGNLALFSAIYGYEGSGEPSWYTATSTLVSSGGGWAALSMPLQRCRDGQVLGATGAKPASCAPASHGAATMQFTADGTNALVTLANGNRIPIRRYKF